MLGMRRHELGSPAPGTPLGDATPVAMHLSIKARARLLLCCLFLCAATLPGQRLGIQSG